MKTIVYTKTCMLLIFLLCVVHTLSSQEMGSTTIEASDSIYQLTTDSTEKSMFEQKTNSLPASVETRSCVNTFMNQTVSSNLSIWGCSNLTVQYITVTNGGFLSLSAPGEIIINGTFDVLLGSALDAGIASAPTPAVFNYLYDASGNRTARQYGATRLLSVSDVADEGNEKPESGKTDNDEPDHHVTE